MHKILIRDNIELPVYLPSLLWLSNYYLLIKVRNGKQHFVLMDDSSCSGSGSLLKQNMSVLGNCSVILEVIHNSQKQIHI
jgi:hypothetical protein